MRWGFKGFWRKCYHDIYLKKFE